MCLLGVVVLAAVRGRWPVGVLDVAAAGTAAAVVAGLRDPAANLLSAMPTSAARRQARRLMLLVPAGLGLWLAYLAAANLVSRGVGWPLGPAVALVATGCAVAAWTPERFAVEAGVAAPLGWMALARAWSGLHDSVTPVLTAYQSHPWVVTAVASAALLMGRSR
ncbi:hypothetical protein N865_20335 [Intrasporangium oryzae NRRL B-24470]|uniref:Uncharacterized protein n=1 Tax=Intrasporangium oryzae NRRL B-24470 TaxID=1386089 RepID=W9G791_9MICO|nr:hypothetical protein N865_20335 [Intrasporangium oryzae NRRL B-24470]